MRYGVRRYAVTHANASPHAGPPRLLIEDGVRLEAGFARNVLGTEDAREGPLAFAQKRKAEYKGR